VLQVSLNLMENGQFTIWDYVLPAHGEGAVLEITAVEGDHLVGSIDATVHHEDATRPLHADFDIVVEKWRWPMEGLCAW
jgi:hypothetical protein